MGELIMSLLWGLVCYAHPLLGKTPAKIFNQFLTSKAILQK